jgi:phosphatidylserine/phosphatidylglycerophosphate/cardiolipin synthase-like enzyme
MISDKFGSNNGDAAMHNKFMIVDHQDMSSAADDWLWTGSYNLTKSATVDNAENAIEIQDQALAACYTLEFNEMWGSDTDTPDPTRSKFSYRKTNNTPHIFNINGVEVQQYMSPSDQGVNRIVDAIQKSLSSVYFCMLIFQTSSNPSKIADAMKSRCLSIPNFKVKGVFDYEENYNDSYSQYFNMMGTGSKPWNPPADVYLDKENYGTLHHKYLIIDGNGGPGQPTLITGSYNWSNAAENSNDENFLVIKDSTIANLYLQEFAARYHKAGGTDSLTVTSVKTDQDRLLPTTIQLSQNYPNPFNSSTTINYQIVSRADQQVELAIFNLLGQKIKTLVTQKQAAGFYSVRWNGKNEAGELVSSGIYVYQLNVAGVKIEKKLILLQ